MSLIAFHRFLIATAILFSLGFAVRQFTAFQATGNGWALASALLLGIVAVALVYYLIHLRDFLRLPSKGAGLGPAGDTGGRSGNGGQPLLPVSTPPTTPARPPVPDNGHAQEDDDEIRKPLKH
jgi:hypothetical protein